MRCTTTATSTPKREAAKEDRPVSGLVVVTPRDASSPSTFADSSSDSEDSSNTGKDQSKPVPPHIPDSFKRSSKVLFPQATRFPPMKKCRTSPPDTGDSSNAPTSTGTPVARASMITPLKANNDASRMSFHKQTGPDFPVLADSPAIEGKQ